MASACPDPMAWQQQAACLTTTVEFFEPEAPERGRVDQRAKAAEEDAAKQVCATCPVRSDCLAWALDAGEDFGIWGGLTAVERRPLRDRRRRKAVAA